MDWRDDAAFDPEARRNALQHVYATYSTDGGRTWAPNMRVTDRAIDRRFGVWSTGVHGPVALASLDSAAYVAWDDSRNGTPETHAQDVYFTRVRFPGAELSGSVPAAPTGMRLAWGVAGAGAALGLAGLALLAARVASAARRREGVAEQVRQV